MDGLKVGTGVELGVVGGEEGVVFSLGLGFSRAAPLGGLDDGEGEL